MDYIWNSLFGPSSAFERFSTEHIIPLSFFILLTYIWIKRGLVWDTVKQHLAAFYFSIGLAFAVIFWMVFKAMTNTFDWKEDLPFHLCNILAIIFPVALYLQLRWLFGILYFWVLVGTLQAVITPDLKEGFPHFVYFRYWWVHCGLITLMLYGIVVLKWRIYVRDIGNAIIGANVYLFFSFPVNILSGGNYYFSMRKPDAATLLDYLGPWPWYLLTGQLVMLFLFILYYLPIKYYQEKIAR